MNARTSGLLSLLFAILACAFTWFGLDELGATSTARLLLTLGVGFSLLAILIPRFNDAA